MTVRPDRLTVFGVIALTCYLCTTFVHVVSLATDSWSTIRLDGWTVRLGLWHGCYVEEVPPDQPECTSDIFSHNVFVDEYRQLWMVKQNHWQRASRALMITALVALILGGVVIASNFFFPHLERMALAVGASAFIAGLCHFVTLILYGAQIGQLDEGQLGPSYGILAICLLLDIATFIFINVDQRKRIRTDILAALKRYVKKSKSEDISLPPTKKSKPEHLRLSSTKKSKFEDMSPTDTKDHKNIEDSSPPSTKEHNDMEELRIPQLNRPPEPVSFNPGGAYDGPYSGSQDGLAYISYREGSKESLV